MTASSPIRRVLAGAAATAAGLALALAGSLPAAAATDTDDSGVSVDVNEGITIVDLTDLSLSGVTGELATSTTTYTIYTTNSTGYTVGVHAAGVTTALTAVGTADTIPFGDVKVEDSASEYQAMPTGVAADVNTHVTDEASAQDGDDLTDNYQLRIPAVAPVEAPYTGTITYTATTNANP